MLADVHSLSPPPTNKQTNKQQQVSAEHPDYSTHKLLLGTHTATGEQNYLMQATVSLPLPDTEIDAKRYDDERGEVRTYGVG